MSTKRLRYYLTVVIGAIILTMLVGFTDAFSAVSKTIDDSLFRSPAVVDTRVKIIALSSPMNSYDYGELARLVDILLLEEVAAIGLNVYLPSSGNPDLDGLLIEKLAQTDRVVLPVYAGLVYGTAGAPNLMPPFARFSQQADLGLKLVMPDGDGILRHAFIKADIGGSEVESFSYRLYQRFLSRSGAENLWEIEDFPQGMMLIDYVAGNEQLEVIRAEDALAGNIAEDYLRGSVVLVGEWLPETNRYMTPLADQGFLYDTAVEGNIMQQLINGRKLTVLNPGLRLLLMFGAAALVALIISHFSLLPGMIAVLMLSFVIYQGNSLLYLSAGVMNPVLESVTAMAFAFVISASYTVVEDRVRATEKFLNSLIEVMVSQVETQTKYNADHSHRVKELAMKIADGFPELGQGARRALAMAASLHDVGKIGVPAVILNKSTRLGDDLQKVLRQIAEEKSRQVMLQASENGGGADELAKIDARFNAYRTLVERLNDPAVEQTEQDETMIKAMADGKNQRALLNEHQVNCLLLKRGTLTADERKAVEEHVNYTSRYLSYVRFPGGYKKVPDITAKHHEKLNGTGYPKGLAASDIPLEARILQVADIADAILAADRPYKDENSWTYCERILEGMAASGEIDRKVFQVVAERGLLQWHTLSLIDNSSSKERGEGS